MRKAVIASILFLSGSALAAPPKIDRQKLSNGLEVLVVENHAVPIFTVEIAAKNGSMTEPPEYNGLSHLYEHMFFKANAVIPSQEAWLSRVHELGLQWNGTTNTECVNYFFTTTSDHFNAAMTFMRDAIVSPVFDAKELERERVVVTGEIDRNEANPYYHFFHDVSQKVWWKYPSRKDPLGSRKTVLAATVDMMKTIQKRYYVPNNSVLVVTGDVKPQEVFAEAEKLYGTTWKQAEDPFKKFPLVKHPALSKSEVVLITQPVQTFNGSLTWHGPSTVGDGVELTYAADVLGTAVGERSSKWQKHLVESGACVGANMGWYTQMNTGPITVSFEAAPDKVDKCVKAILDELPHLKDKDYISDEEMKNAANTLDVQTTKQREKLSAYAHTLTFWWTSAGLDYYLGYIDKLKKVTQPDIAKYVDRYMTNKPFVFGALVSPEMVKSGLDKAHFEKLANIGGKK